MKWPWCCFLCCGSEGFRASSRYASQQEELDVWPQWHNLAASEKYDILEQLGEGAFSRVLVGQEKETGERVAIKVVYRTPELKAEHWDILRNEARVLRDCQHPNVVEMKEMYEDEDRLVMVLELCSGRELLEDIKEVKHYSEQDASRIFFQLASALSHIHSKGYMHRDLKPENVMFVEDPGSRGRGGRGMSVKLLDFGMASPYDPANPIRAAMGTPGYLSPESCHKVPHTPAMDIWSLGVILFVMLCGRMPYSHMQIEALQYPQIDFRMSPGYKSPRFRGLSRPARHLVMRLLERDPRERATAEEVLSHPWMTFMDGDADADDEGMMSSPSQGAPQSPDGFGGAPESPAARLSSGTRQKKQRGGGSGRPLADIQDTEQIELQVMIPDEAIADD